MRAILRGVAGENASALRSLTGQGEPGLWTLLGGTNAEPDDGGRRRASGGRSFGASARDRLMAGGRGGGGWDLPGSIRSPDEMRDAVDRFRRER